MSRIIDPRIEGLLLSRERFEKSLWNFIPNKPSSNEKIIYCEKQLERIDAIIDSLMDLEEQSTDVNAGG